MLIQFQVKCTRHKNLHRNKDKTRRYVSFSKLWFNWYNFESHGAKLRENRHKTCVNVEQSNILLINKWE